MSDDLDNYTLVRACTYCKRIINQDGTTSPMRPLNNNERLSHGACAECSDIIHKAIDLKLAMENVIKDE
jgi:RNA polymerase subunit RPABC4/transcription elongation factor Spt4